MAACGVWFVSGSAAKQGLCDPEFVLIGAAGGHGDLDAPHTHPDQGADFQQLQADRAARCRGELGMDKPDPSPPAAPPRHPR